MGMWSERSSPKAGLLAALMMAGAPEAATWPNGSDCGATLAPGVGIAAPLEGGAAAAITGTAPVEV